MYSFLQFYLSYVKYCPKPCRQCSLFNSLMLPKVGMRRRNACRDRGEAYSTWSSTTVVAVSDFSKEDGHQRQPDVTGKDLSNEGGGGGREGEEVKEALWRWSSDPPIAHTADSVLSACKTADWIKALPTNLLTFPWRVHTHKHTHDRWQRVAAKVTHSQTGLRWMCLLLWLDSNRFYIYHIIPLSPSSVLQQQIMFDNK